MTTMPKAPVSEKSAPSQGKAIDLSHHLSKVSRERKLSPLKGLQKYFGKPGIISLAGGWTYFVSLRSTRLTIPSPKVSRTLLISLSILSVQMSWHLSRSLPRPTRGKKDPSPGFGPYFPTGKTLLFLSVFPSIRRILLTWIWPRLCNTV